MLSATSQSRGRGRGGKAVAMATTPMVRQVDLKTGARAIGMSDTWLRKKARQGGPDAPPRIGTSKKLWFDLDALMRWWKSRGGKR